VNSSFQPSHLTIIPMVGDWFPTETYHRTALGMLPYSRPYLLDAVVLHTRPEKQLLEKNLK